jgi:hypothetical protein
MTLNDSGLPQPEEGEGEVAFLKLSGTVYHSFSREKSRWLGWHLVTKCGMDSRLHPTMVVWPLSKVAAHYRACRRCYEGIT